MVETHKVQYTHSSLDDMRSMKKYILQKFHYHELGESFTKKMKRAERELASCPAGYKDTGILYRGYIVYAKSSQSYLFFFVVDKKEKVVTVLRVLQERMNWKYILKKWLKTNK